MDIWDAVAIVGVSLVATGIGFIYWPMALIFVGSVILIAYVLKEYTYVSPQSDKRDEEAYAEDGSD